MSESSESSEQLIQPWALRGDARERATEALARTGREGAALDNVVIKWTVQEFPTFMVEYAQLDNDVVYHFWPPGNKAEFVPGFGRSLEAGFRQCLPEDADVRADFMSRHEDAAQAIMASNQLEDDRGVPIRESYYVRVVDFADRPFADRILKGKILIKVREAVELSI